MTDTRTASERIVAEATSWPGVEAGPGHRGGELAISFGKRELGHLHGDRAAHFGFPRQVWAELLEQGRVVRHPIDRPGWAARGIESDADVDAVIELLRLNYDRAAGRDRLPAGLHASPPHPLPFAPSLHARAFVLERDQGNLLVYSAPTLTSDTVDGLGGIARQYLNHRHEAGFGAGALGAPLFTHASERDSVERTAHVRGTFSRRHLLDGDFEVIPTPGHTPGATAYLWDSGEYRFLFTGDTIYLDGGEWVAAVLDSSDRGPYLESLELIRELDFDVLVPWAATAGRPFHAPTAPGDARRRIDAIVERVRAGESR